MANEDLDVAILAAFTGGQLNQIDALTIEPVNKSALNRGGGKSNLLDPKSFLPKTKTPTRSQQPLPNFNEERVISNEITVVPIPDDLKQQAAKYMQPQQPEQPVVQQTIQQPQIIRQPNNTGLNNTNILLAIDKKLDTILERLELICKTAKIVRK
jgi:hypothetical protein